MEQDYQTKLTKKEISYFKNGLPGEASIFLALKIVFSICWGVWMVFLIFLLLTDWNKYADCNTLMLLILFTGFGLLFWFCIHVIKKRQDHLYKAIKNGDYQLVITTISKKDYYFQKNGPYIFMKVYFYSCQDLRDQITPISTKQYKKAKEGDSLKVVILHNPHVCYGIREQTV